MPFSASCRILSVTIPGRVNSAPLMALADLCIVAIDPAVLPAASDYAKWRFPNTSLARAV